MYNPLFGIIALLAAFAAVGGITCIMAYSIQRKSDSSIFYEEKAHRITSFLKIKNKFTCANEIAKALQESVAVVKAVLSQMHYEGKVVVSPAILSDGKCSISGGCECIRSNTAGTTKYKIKDQV